MKCFKGIILFIAFLWAGISVSVGAVTEKDLQKAVLRIVSSNPHFSFIQEQAKELNLKVYFYGGTAAAIGMYAKWMTARRSGGIAGRDYHAALDYTLDHSDIFLPNQDLDLAVEPGEGQTREEFSKNFETLIERTRAKFPYTSQIESEGPETGKRSIWDFHTIRTRGPVAGRNPRSQEPILSSNFRNQHTDSMSTGIIDIATGTIEDLAQEMRRVQSNLFLKSLLTGTIHFLFSKKHDSTSYAQSGDNPPVISVIRLITKAYLYHMSITSTDTEKLAGLVRQGQVPVSDYGKRMLEILTVKMFMNTSDLEGVFDYALRIKLTDYLKSLSTGAFPRGGLIVDKEPLRTLRGDARRILRGSITAKEYFKAAGIDIGKTWLVHRTGEDQGYITHKRMTRNFFGKINAFTSRASREGRGGGETAQYGTGFYCSQKGSGGNAPIEFLIDPDAIMGVDIVDNYNKDMKKSKASLENLRILNLGIIRKVRQYDIAALISDPKNSNSFMQLIEFALSTRNMPLMQKIFSHSKFDLNATLRLMKQSRQHSHEFLGYCIDFMLRDPVRYGRDHLVSAVNEFSRSSHVDKIVYVLKDRGAWNELPLTQRLTFLIASHKGLLENWKKIRHISRSGKKLETHQQDEFSRLHKSIGLTTLELLRLLTGLDSAEHVSIRRNLLNYNSEIYVPENNVMRSLVGTQSDEALELAVETYQRFFIHDLRRFEEFCKAGKTRKHALLLEAFEFGRAETLLTEKEYRKRLDSILTKVKNRKELNWVLRVMLHMCTTEFQMAFLTYLKNHPHGLDRERTLAVFAKRMHVGSEEVARLFLELLNNIRSPLKRKTILLSTPSTNDKQYLTHQELATFRSHIVAYLKQERDSAYIENVLKEIYEFQVAPSSTLNTLIMILIQEEIQSEDPVFNIIRKGFEVLGKVPTTETHHFLISISNDIDKRVRLAEKRASLGFVRGLFTDRQKNRRDERSWKEVERQYLETKQHVADAPMVRMLPTWANPELIDFIVRKRSVTMRIIKTVGDVIEKCKGMNPF